MRLGSCNYLVIMIITITIINKCNREACIIQQNIVLLESPKNIKHFDSHLTDSGLKQL